jgi:hypothetical protein
MAPPTSFREVSKWCALSALSRPDRLQNRIEDLLPEGFAGLAGFFLLRRGGIDCSPDGDGPASAGDLTGETAAIGILVAVLTWGSVVPESLCWVDSRRAISRRPTSDQGHQEQQKSRSTERDRVPRREAIEHRLHETDPGKRDQQANDDTN